MYRKKDSWLWGLKFIGNKGETLLATVLIDRKIFRQNPEEWPICEVVLEEGERIVGVKSEVRADCLFDF